MRHIMNIISNYQIKSPYSNYKLINQSKQTTPSFGAKNLNSNITKKSYDILRKEIFEGKHKTLADGTIRQYKVRQMNTEKRRMDYNEYKNKVIDIPVKDLFPDGKIVTYEDIPLKEIRSGKLFVILEDDTPVDVLTNMTIYYPNGEIYRIKSGKMTQLV